jgi:NAD(P)-dependent dehydrogenase (short-subunit alcohol dehydrogenase family)
MERSPQRLERPPVVVVTGASAGVGRATAFAFAERGYAVGLIARGRERLESAERTIKSMGLPAFAVQADVADAATVDKAADLIEAEMGPIELWVNNAMATVFGPVWSLTPEEIRRVTEVTYLGQVHGTLSALRRMRPRDRGTIVQVGSALSYRSIPLQSAYCGAKAAIRGFTDSLRSELEHEGSAIRLTMVQLPAVNTPQFDWARSRLPRRLQPVPPIHDPDAVANAIVAAAEEAPREMWIGGPTVEAILGTMVAPNLLDHMMTRRAWDGQMTDEPAQPRKGNLFDVPPGDPGSHGRFGSRSCANVMRISGSMARSLVTSAALGCVAGAAGLGWFFGRRNARVAD